MSDNPPKPTKANSGIRKYGINARKTLNPVNYQITQTDNGQMSGTAIWQYDYEVNKKIPDGFLPIIGEAHPLEPRITATNITQNYGSNGICLVEVSYSGGGGGGVSSGGGRTDFTWELSCTTSDEPIDTHPNFHNMGTAEIPNTGGAVQTKQHGEGAESNKGQYYVLGQFNWARQYVEVDNSQRFVGFKNTAFTEAVGVVGVRSFRRPGAVLRVSYQTRNGNDSKWLMANLGKTYSEIPFSQVRAEMNANVSGRNWLFISAGIQKQGNNYRVQAEFQLSGEKGWNKFIYMPGQS